MRLPSLPKPLQSKGEPNALPLRSVWEARQTRGKHERFAVHVAYSPAPAAGRLSDIYGGIIPAYRSHIAGADMRRQDQGRDALQTERPVRQWPVPPAWWPVHRAENKGRQAAVRCQRQTAQTEAQHRRRKADPMRGQEVLISGYSKHTVQCHPFRVE